MHPEMYSMVWRQREDELARSLARSRPGRAPRRRSVPAATTSTVGAMLAAWFAGLGAGAPRAGTPSAVCCA